MNVRERLVAVMNFETPDRNLLAIRCQYPRLQIAKGREAIDRELESKIPFMLQHGGYIPHLDHAAHPDISWPDFCYYRSKLLELIEEHAGTGR